MAFSLSALGAYTKESVEPLLQAAIFGGETLDIILKGGTPMPGVKGPQKMPILSSDAFFQTDACGWNASGTTTITQRDITVGKIKIEEALCPKELEDKFTVQALRAGSTYEAFEPAAFEAAFLEQRNKNIAKKLEEAVWKGDTASGDGYLNKFDGLIKQIDAGSPVSANVAPYTSTTTAIDSTNVLAIVRSVKNKIPAALQGDTSVMIFLGYDVYNLYVDAGIAANYFHFDFNDKSSYSGITIPGTAIKLKAVHGLDGTGDLYATRVENMVAAFDVENEQENYDLWYSKDNNEMRFRVAFKLGVNVGFTTEVVSFKGTV